MICVVLGILKKFSSAFTTIVKYSVLHTVPSWCFTKEISGSSIVSQGLPTAIWAFISFKQGSVCVGTSTQSLQFLQQIGSWYLQADLESF